MFILVFFMPLIVGPGLKQINNATCLQGQTVRSVLTPSGPLPAVLSSFSDSLLFSSEKNNLYLLYRFTCFCEHVTVEQRNLMEFQREKSLFCYQRMLAVILGPVLLAFPSLLHNVKNSIAGQYENIELLMRSHSICYSLNSRRQRILLC